MRKWKLGAISAVTMALFAPNVMAADLGGNCCGDLEERIAELEATTARKGNRKVSLSISGYVSHSVMFWDDGGASNMFIGDGGNVSSRFRLKGEAKINADMTAGFLYEFGAYNNLIGSMTQGAGGDDLGGTITLRDSTVWLRHKNLGMLKIGHGSTATDNLILIDLGGTSSIVTPDVGLFNGSFQTRVSSLTFNGTAIPGAAGQLSGITWNQFLNGGISFDTARRNHVMYETPTLAGFVLSAAVAENDFWDVALRWSGEFGGFRMAAGIGRSVDKEAPTFGPLLLAADKITQTMGSASVMHVASGLFLTGSAGLRETDWSFAFGPATITAKDASYWQLVGGWSKNVFGMGATTLYAEYLMAKDMIGYSLTGPGVSGNLESDARVWGIGMVQNIDAAAMELFLSYKRFEADANLNLTAGGTLNIDAQMHDFSAVIGGMKISF